jgi:hypothetical protein
MDIAGLLGKYLANRPLNEKDFTYQLKQKVRLNVEPLNQLSTIKMNSTYLESVDKWYATKGELTAYSILIFIILVGLASLLSVGWLMQAAEIYPGPETTSLLANGLAMGAVGLLMAWCIAWVLRKESFAYTHYPMRFNRRTRMVYVFRPNGTVLSVPWDDIFFTVAPLPPSRVWEIHGNVLDEDKVTIKEIFALGYTDILDEEDTRPGCTHFSSRDFVRAHWEFIRRYMEEGPQEVTKQVKFCMPIAEKRESYKVGFERMFANIAALPAIFYWLFFPFLFIASMFRVFAIQTSKVPQWPKEVEADCLIDQDDPYAIEGDETGERVAVFPAAAEAAGVRFVAFAVPGQST